ncbi:hypothetical protein C8R44DRAFT_807613 [Mycena epipterygia]|nr:hypothetical protein C8R44DRAFT_807613 [Mycena epipterygia]
MLPTRLLNSVTIAWTIAGLTNPQEFSRHTHRGDPVWYPDYIAPEGYEVRPRFGFSIRDFTVLAKRVYYAQQELERAFGCLALGDSIGVSSLP